MPDIVGLEQHEPTSLWGIAERAAARKDHRFQNLYRLLDVPFLWRCWDDLNKRAASGVDGVTAQEYEENLLGNLRNLVERLKTKRYRAKLVRRCYIPKENGAERPLGIPALEDKLVQLACARILGAIYEQEFEPFSYAYRPGRSAQEAIGDLGFNLQYGSYGYIVEADIKGFSAIAPCIALPPASMQSFDNIDHGWLLEMLKLRIDDQAFLALLAKWLKAGILETDGHIIHPESGTPQGGIVSPILANIYLHYALDLWFERVVRPKVQGDAILIRYADDFVCAFQYKDEAERFYAALPGRLAKFQLQVAPEKTAILRFSRFRPGLPRRFTFLGFELYWAPDRRGEIRVMKRTARKKLQAAKQRIKQWIKLNRHLPGKAFIKALNRKLVGHYNYYGVRSNEKALGSFFAYTIACAFKWLNRRGGKKASFNWTVFNRAIKKLGVAWPKVTEQRQQHRVFA